MERLISGLGLLVMLFLAWLLSNNRRKIDFKLVGIGVLMQLVFGMLILWTYPGEVAFDAARVFITKLLSFSDAGSEMVFGENFQEHFVAFSVLPTIIFVSSLMAVFFYLGIIQRIVALMAKLMMKFMGVSGAESLAASANVFMGQTEAPLAVKPYMETMTRSELMALMTGGMATVAGGTMAAYVNFGVDPGHLLAASIMSAPASLVLAKIMVPEVEESQTRGEVKIEIETQDANILDAISRGAGEGLKLALNVAAMLIAFVAIAHGINYGLGFLPEVAGEPLTLQRLLGWGFAPLAFCMGIAPSDILEVGSLLGEKVILNEFIAYDHLQDMEGSLSDRSFTIATYALCGFANFGSIGIQIGGLGALVPGRRADFAKFGFKAMIGGTLAAFMTACVAGLLI